MLYKWQVKLETSLNRRADVENYLIQASTGTQPLPDRKKCLELACVLSNALNPQPLKKSKPKKKQTTPSKS